MRLMITTPFGVALDAPDVLSVQAEDASGSFGIMRGHVPFVTVLVVGVAVYRDLDGTPHYIAVRGGVLDVDERGDVRVATPEAIRADDLEVLEREVLSGLRVRAQADDAQREAARRLEEALFHELRRYLHPERAPHGETGGD